MVDAVLGLPDAVRGCLFDLDGVLTQTATVHADAWKEMFDAFLRRRAGKAKTVFVPFDSVADYDAYAGARALGVQPLQAAVFDDALAGVEAGRAGGFGLVVGVDRVGQADALRGHGTDVVVTDLSELFGPR